MAGVGLAAAAFLSRLDKRKLAIVVILLSPLVLLSMLHETAHVPAAKPVFRPSPVFKQAEALSTSVVPVSPLLSAGPAATTLPDRRGRQQFLPSLSRPRPGDTLLSDGSHLKRLPHRRVRQPSRKG